MGASTTTRGIEVEPFQSFGVHNLPQIARDAGSGTVGFNVYAAGLWSYFFLIPCYTSICNFWNGYVHLVLLNIGSV